MPDPLLPGLQVVTVTDGVIVAVVLLAAWRGARRGFLAGTLGLLWLVLPVLVALQFSGPVAGALAGSWSPTWTRPAAFVALFVLTGALTDSLGWALLGRLPRRAHAAPLNRLSGVLQGATTGVLTAGVVVAVLFTLPVPAGLQADLNRSRLAAPLWQGARLAGQAAGPVFGEALRALQPRRAPGRHVDLPFTVRDAPPAPLLEARMLELVNAARAKAGLPGLRADPALRAVARRHSADMFARGYFAHVNPDGASPFDRMKGAGVRYFTAGENLALAPTVGAAHVNLMNSPGHRANILGRRFGRVGIGIVDGGHRGVMVTQAFRN
ncbi:CvpA family protein (plasmid) [Deinococcus taeanensis]|uniref:CvpA family protein n=1 Tax=Deinococcus taeanensis TaxID=2737050 RepID=UPI001CDD1BA9|nr:CvpA family protein [Deinococcus taeanensis]UBV44413.1 CvpA family protein [Deinococcus taeanensis]